MALKLEDPNQRMQSEVFVDWAAAHSYSHCADEHDYALQATKEFFADSATAGHDEAVRVVRAWAGVVVHPDVRAAISQRLESLGVTSSNEFLPQLVGNLVIPDVVRQDLDSGTWPETDLATALATFGAEARAGAEAMADRAERVVGDQEWMNGLSNSDVSNLVDRIVSSAEEIRELAPNASRRMIEATVTAASSTAWARANSGDLAAAEVILDDLASSDLPEALQIEIDQDLGTIRDAMRRRSQTAPSGGAVIGGTEGLTVRDVSNEIQLGGRFVVFEYIVSIILVSFKRTSDVYFIKASESSLSKGWPYLLMTFLLGWWSIHGFFWTIGALFTNFNGGHDVTMEVMASQRSRSGGS